MIKAYLIIGLIFCSIRVSGQTNNSLPSIPLSLPPVQLRPDLIQSASVDSQKPIPPDKNPPPDNITASLYYDDDLYHRLERGGYLTPRVQSAPDGIEGFLLNVFEPEVIHFREIDVSCSIVTALNRRNPLCLLNPIVVLISW